MWTMGTLICQTSVALTETLTEFPWFLTKQNRLNIWCNWPTSLNAMKGNEISAPERETFRVGLKYELKNELKYGIIPGAPAQNDTQVAKSIAFV